MRAIWKGTISFGLVTVPVGLHSLLDPKGELAFRLLHRKDASPIDYRRFSEKEDVDEGDQAQDPRQGDRRREAGAAT